MFFMVYVPAEADRAKFIMRMLDGHFYHRGRYFASSAPSCNMRNGLHEIPGGRGVPRFGAKRLIRRRLYGKPCQPISRG
jgi:hypothetical protein